MPSIYQSQGYSTDNYKSQAPSQEHKINLLPRQKPNNKNKPLANIEAICQKQTHVRLFDGDLQKGKLEAKKQQSPKQSK